MRMATSANERTMPRPLQTVVVLLNLISLRNAVDSFPLGQQSTSAVTTYEFVTPMTTVVVPGFSTTIFYGNRRRKRGKSCARYSRISHDSLKLQRRCRASLSLRATAVKTETETGTDSPLLDVSSNRSAYDIFNVSERKDLMAVSHDKKNGKSQPEENENSKKSFSVRGLWLDVTSNRSAYDIFNVSEHGNFTAASLEEKNGKSQPEENENSKKLLSMRSLWRRRHAKSLDEGIRREKTSQLSSLLSRAQAVAKPPEGRKNSERLIMGLINGLAEEVEGLDVEIDMRQNTPLWRKEVDEVRILYKRIGFKQLQMGGCKIAERKLQQSRDEHGALSMIETADEAFDRIDVDKSGALDSEEIAIALDRLAVAEYPDKNSIEELAIDLVELYDQNGDGVVDRDEYQLMIEDMAALNEQRLNNQDDSQAQSSEGFLSGVRNSFNLFSQGVKEKAVESANSLSAKFSGDEQDDGDSEEDTIGSIVLSGLKLDMRRLAFGAVPVMKRVTPGGPLVLEPFTMTIAGSFNSEDVLGSFLLDTGLRLLVARALRVRLRTFRDIVDGAFFVGRRWKLFSKSAPVVDILQLSNVEFDKNDKMVITGKARVRASPDSPVVTNTFKVRTKIGTKRNGQSIRLVEPELAFVFECPENWEKGLGVVCQWLGLPEPEKPKPLYSFFPIYSPFKVDDNAGFDMGDDNKLKSIYIKNGALRFEMSAVLRPGRFLGNHYLAFTIPNRTFIVTLDRVKEGMRNARKNKKLAALEKKLEMEEAAATMKRLTPRRNRLEGANALRQRFVSNVIPKRKEKRPQPKSFFSRFVEGYTSVEREADSQNENLGIAISSWFGRQIKERGTAQKDNARDGTDGSSETRRRSEV